MISEATINKYNIFRLTKSPIVKDGVSLFLGKSMDESFVVIKIDKNGYEHEPVRYSSYSKARSSIGNPARMVPVFNRNNLKEVRCDCCGQILRN